MTGKKLRTINRLKRYLLAGLFPIEIRELMPEVSPARISQWREKLGLPKFKRGNWRGKKLKRHNL